MNPLSQSVKKTLSYFDLYDRPLTAEELFDFLWQPPFVSYEDFLKELLVSEAAENKNGFWFLPGRAEMINRHNEKTWLNDKKMRIARRATSKLRLIPFIKAIFVCNTVGMLTANEKSDIDFFIITAPGRIWLVRLFANLLLRFLGLRVYGHTSKDRICLSFFTDEKSLDFSDIRIKEDDVYLAYWLKHLTPLFDPDDLGAEISRRNPWLKKYLPNATEKIVLSTWGISDGRAARVWKKFWEVAWRGMYGDILNRQARAIQEDRIKKTLKDKNLLDGRRMVYNESMVKLHQNDAREKIYRDWQALCR